MTEKTLHTAFDVLNTDDPVPSTNLPLRNALNFDITGSKERESFVPLEGDSLHSWPAAWYGSHPGVIEKEGSGMSRGDVVRILT